MSQTTNSTSLRLVTAKNWKSDWISTKKDYSQFVIFDLAIRKYIQVICTTKRLNCHKFIFKKESNRIVIYVSLFDYIWKKQPKKKEFKGKKYLNNRKFNNFKNRKNINVKKIKIDFLQNLKNRKIQRSTKKNILKINMFLLNAYLTKYVLTLGLPFEVNIFFITSRFRDYHVHQIFYEVLQKLRKLQIFSPFLNILSTAIFTHNASILNAFLIKNLKQNQRHKQFFKKINFIFTKLLNSYSNFYGFKIQFKGKINGAARARKFIIKGGILPKTTFKNLIIYDCQFIKTVAGICSIKTWLFFEPIDFSKKLKKFPSFKKKSYKKNYNKNKPFNKNFTNNKNKSFNKNFVENKNKSFNKNFVENKNKSFNKNFINNKNKPLNKNFTNNKNKPFNKT